MQAHLLINTLFKTAEYKLVNSDCLKITELSLYNARSKKVLLNSIKYEDGQSLPSFLSYLVLFIGFSLIAATFYFGQQSTLLNNNLLNITFFLSCITGALAFILKPAKTYTYRDTYSNNILLRINKSAMINNATDSFVTALNEAIEKTQADETKRINLNKNAAIQYDIHNKNVDEMFNLGLIDEVLYNRICTSMHEKVFGKVTHQSMGSNIIYLNR